MTQAKIKQLQKLLIEWGDFIGSGRHEAPDAKSDAEAKVQSEPMMMEVAYLLARQVKRWEL